MADQSDETAVESDRGGPESDASDAVKPWTIKAVPPEERNAAIAAAKRAGVPIGAWLSRAIRGHIAAERGQRGLAVRQPDPRPALADVERLLAAAEKLSAISGEPPPKGVQRLGYGLIRDGLQAVKRSARDGGRSDRGGEEADDATGKSDRSGTKSDPGSTSVAQ